MDRRRADRSSATSRSTAGPCAAADFVSWRGKLAPRLREPATILRRACHIAPSRDINLDRMRVAAESINADCSCYTLQPDVIEHAHRQQGTFRIELTDDDRPSASARLPPWPFSLFPTWVSASATSPSSRRFYENVLGFKHLFDADLGPEIERTMEVPGCQFTSCLLGREDLNIELIGYREPAVPATAPGGR